MRLEHVIAQAKAALEALDAPAGLIDPELEAEREQRARARHRREFRAAAVERMPVTEEDARRIIEDKLDDRHALRVVKRWLEAAPCPWLVLSGGTGTGKTVAAAYAAAELGGMYVSAPELRPLFTRSAWDRGADRDRAEALMTTRLLVIDDLGTEVDEPEKFASELFKVLNARQRLRTIVTTNLSPERLLDPKRYTDRVVDRLEHMTTTSAGVSAIFALGGKSLRRKLVKP
jgi:DNA replication protein DnaC